MTTHKNIINSALFRALKAENQAHNYIAIKQNLIDLFGHVEAHNVLQNLTIDRAQTLTGAALFHTLSDGFSKLWDYLSKAVAQGAKTINDLSRLIVELSTQLPHLAASLKSIQVLFTSTTTLGFVLDLLNVYLGFYYRVPWPLLATLISRLAVSFMTEPGRQIGSRVKAILQMLADDLKSAYHLILANVSRGQFGVAQSNSPSTTTGQAFVEFFKSLVGLSNYDDRDITTIIQKMRAQIGLFKDVKGIFSLVQSLFDYIKSLFSCSKLSELDPYQALIDAEKLLPDIGKTQLMVQFGKNPKLAADIPVHYKKLYELRPFFYALNRDKPDMYQRYVSCLASFSLAMIYIDSFQKSHQSRTTPPIVHFHGDPGVGKSRLVRILAHQLHRLLKRIPDEDTVTDYEAYYTRNINDAFQDAYSNQTVYYYDDPNQHMSTDVLVPFLIDLIAMGQDTPHQLPMSSVEMKSGGFFNSSFVFLTTNGTMESIYTLCNNHIQDLDAIRRRITYTVRVTSKGRTDSLDDWGLRISKFAGFVTKDGTKVPQYVDSEMTVEEFRDELLTQLEKNKSNTASIRPLTIPKNVKVKIPDVFDTKVPLTVAQGNNDDEFLDPSDPEHQGEIMLNAKQIVEEITESVKTLPNKSSLIPETLCLAQEIGVPLQKMYVRPNPSEEDVIAAIREYPYFKKWDSRFSFVMSGKPILEDETFAVETGWYKIYCIPSKQLPDLKLILSSLRQNMHWLFTNHESLLYFTVRNTLLDRIRMWTMNYGRAITPTVVDKAPDWFQLFVNFAIAFWIGYSTVSMLFGAINLVIDFFMPTADKVVVDDVAQVAYPKDHAVHAKNIYRKPEIKKLNIAQGGGSPVELISKNVRQLVLCRLDKSTFPKSMIHALVVKRGYYIYPHHMWVAIPEDAVFIRTYDFFKHEFAYVPIDQALAKTFQIGQDIVMTDFTGLFQDSRDIIRHFATLDQIKSLSDDRGQLVKVSFNVPLMPLIESISAPLRRCATAQYTAHGDHIYSLTGALRFMYPTEGGDCGFTYVASFKETDKIVGFHVAGDGRTGTGLIISRETIEEAVEKLNSTVAQGVSSGEVRVVEPTNDIPRVTFDDEQHIRVLKVVPRDHAAFLPFKSVVEPNYTFMNLFTGPHLEEIREPTKLRPFTNNAGERVDPVAVAARKLKGEQKEVDPHALAVFKDVAELYRNTWPLGKSAQLKTISEALNGTSDAFKPLNMKKSAGLNSIVAKTSGKYAFVHCSTCHKTKDCVCLNKAWDLNKDFSYAYSELIKALERGDKSDALIIVFLDCLKSELRKSSKVQSGLTRLFSPGPFELLLAVRQYFGYFMEMFNAHPFEMSSGIGLNPHSSQWKMLFDTLSEKPKAIFADATNWDANMIVQLIMIIHEEINHWYAVTRQKDIINGLPHDSQEDFDLQQKVRTQIALHTYNTVRLLNNVLYVCPGNPSGQGLTGIINTLYNNVVTRSAMVLSGKVSALEVFERSRLSATGDDIVVTHDLDYSCEEHKSMIAHYNVQLTPADKSSQFDREYYALSDGDYLKRRFRVDGSLVFAPLDQLSVFGMVNWKSTGMSDKSAAKAVYDCFSIEVMHYGKNVYDTQTKIYRDHYVLQYQDNLPHKTYEQRVFDFKNGQIGYEFAQSGNKGLVADKRSEQVLKNFAPGAYEGSYRKVGFSTKASQKGEHNDAKVRRKFEGHSVQFMPTPAGSRDIVARPVATPADFRPNANHRNALRLPSMPSNPLPKQQPAKPKGELHPTLLLKFGPPKDDKEPKNKTPKHNYSAVSDAMLADEMFGVGPKISAVDKSFKPKKNHGLKSAVLTPEAKSLNVLLEEKLKQEPVAIRHYAPDAQDFIDLDEVPLNRTQNIPIPSTKEESATSSKITPSVVENPPKGPREPEVPQKFSPTKMTAHKNKQGSESQRKIPSSKSIAKKTQTKSAFFKKEFRPRVPHDAVATRVLNAYNFSTYEKYLDTITEYKMKRNEDLLIHGDTSFHYAQNNLSRLTKQSPRFAEVKISLTYPLIKATVDVDGRSFDGYGMSPITKTAQKLACLNLLNEIAEVGVRQVPDYMLTSIKSQLCTPADVFEKNIAQSGYSGQKVPTDDSIEQKANVAIQEDSVSSGTVVPSGNSRFHNMINPYLDMTPTELLSRQILIGSFPISTSASGIVVQLPFPQVASTYYSSLLNRFAMFHCDFEIESRLNANFSQQGLLHWSFVPTGAEARLYRSSTTQILQHVANADSVTITIPGLCYNNGFNTIEAGPYVDQRRVQTGTLFCNVISPIREANVSTPVSILMTIYLRLTNIKCYGFKAQSGTTTIADLKAALPSVDAVTTERSKKSGNVSAALDTISDISSTMSVLPKVGPFASSVSALTSLAGAVSRYFGHSMSRSTSASTYVAPRSSPIFANSHGTMATDVMALSVDSSLATDAPVVPSMVDYNLYDNYKLIPFFLPPINVGKTTPLGTLATIPIAPQYMVATVTEPNNTARYRSSIADLANSHQFWTGDTKFSIVVCGNRFTNFRMRAYWKPTYVTSTPSAAQVSDFANRIINVDGPTTSSFTIPFLAQQQWLSTSDSMDDVSLTANGTLVLELLTQPQLLGTVDVPAQVFIFVSGGEAMQFTVPSMDNYAQSGGKGVVADANESNCNDLVAHFTKVFPGIIESHTFVTDRVNMSDVCCSFTERLSRPTFMTQLTVVPTPALTPVPTKLDLNTVYNLTSELQINRHFKRFAANRGSFNLFFQPRTRTDVRLFAQHNRGPSTTNPILVARPFASSDTFNKPYVHITIPDYNPALYHCPAHPETYQHVNEVALFAYSNNIEPVIVDVYFSLGDDFSSSVLTGTPPFITSL